MGRLEKHLGMGEPITIDGEQYTLKSLGTESLPLFFKAMKAFSGAKDNATVAEMFSNMDDAGAKAVTDLIDRTLALTFPDEPEEDRKKFGMRYMTVLLPKIFEINSYVAESQTKAAELVKRINKQ